MQTLLKTTQAYSLLQTEGKERRFGHAYLLLFNDPKNIRLALKTFAKLFFDCAETENEGGMYASNDKKRIAELIDNDSFSDCLFFPSQDKKLTVEDAERIQEECTLNPVEGNRKVFLLADFAEANVQTQNKLLKMLEEPPEGVIFLLGATTVFPVLPTVLSRTKKLEIQPFEISEVTECLTRIYGDKYDRETLALCAAASGGSVGEAQNAVEGGYYITLIENALSLALSTPSRLPAIVKEIGETKHQKELLSLLRILFRDAMLLKTQPSLPRYKLLLPAEKQTTQEIAEKYTLPALFYAQERISEAEKQVKFNAVFPQCIEICIAKILEKNAQTLRG